VRRRQLAPARGREADVDSLRETAASTPNTAGRGQPLTPEAVRSLHRAAGNAAVTSLVLAVQRVDASSADEEAAKYAKVTAEFDEGIREFHVSNERFATFNRIMAGETDENALTDAVFYERHPRLKGHTLDPNKPSERGYVDDWLSIREHIVRPELRENADSTEAAPDEAAAPRI
jgi:hypothetical protein